MASLDYKNINHDLLIDNGDFVKHDAQQDHIENILITSKGSYRQFPLVGVNLIDFVNGPESNKTRLSLAKQIRLQLIADGYEIVLIDTASFSNILIEAEK